MSILGVEFDEWNCDERQQDAARALFAVENRKDTDTFGSDLVLNMHNLWKDPAIQECFRRANEFQLNDSAQYYLDDLERISATDYEPNEQDILRSRVQTTAIVEIRFPTKDMLFRVFDVGGQRSERRKWIHCFENVNAIIFFVALSEYDQVLSEDSSTNRMHESLGLFNSIFNSNWFVKTSFILFLNKKDLLEAKIKRSPLTVCFPEYDGPSDYKSSYNFIKHKFKSVNTSNLKEIYPHPTCATDTKNVQFVLTAVTDMIVVKNLTQSGMY
jgi:guanine nucleotide-binding protein G(o) subunit alpha